MRWLLDDYHMDCIGAQLLDEFKQLTSKWLAHTLSAWIVTTHWGQVDTIDPDISRLSSYDTSIFFWRLDWTFWSKIEPQVQHDPVNKNPRGSDEANSHSTRLCLAPLAGRVCGLATWWGVASAARWIPGWNTKVNDMWQTFSWLVVSTPLKKISQLGCLFPIYGKSKNDWNHQAVTDFTGDFKLEK